MTAPDWKALLDLPWLAWSIGGLIALAGVIVLYRALFADRPRGRRRCPKCWYDMRGTPSLRCPECGHTPKSERRLHRTRRYWRWASLATLCIFGGVAVACVPQVRRDGWMSLVPTTVLLILSAPGPDSLGVFRSMNLVDAELKRRDAAATLWSWQWAYVAQEKCFRYRTRWPRSLPIVMLCSTPDGINGIVHIEEREPWGNSYRYSFVEEFLYARIRPAVIDAASVTFSCRIQQIPTWLPATAGVTFGRMDGQLLWKGTMRLPIRVVESIDDAMRPLRGPEWDAQIRKAVRVCFLRGSERSQFVSMCDGPSVSEFVGVCIARSANPELAELATGFSISLHQRGPVPQWFDTNFGVHRLGPRLSEFAAASSPSVIDPESWSALKADTINELRWGSDWYVVLRGDPELALRDWDKTAYWGGQITLTPDEVWIEGRDPVEDLHKLRVATSP